MRTFPNQDIDFDAAFETFTREKAAGANLPETMTLLMPLLETLAESTAHHYVGGPQALAVNYDDCLGEMECHLFEALSNFTPEQNATGEDFKNYALTVAKNALRDLQRNANAKKRNTPTVEFKPSADDFKAANVPSPMEISMDEKTVMVDQLLKEHLNDTQYRVITTIIRNPDLPHDILANQLDINPVTFRTNALRARVKLARTITSAGGEEFTAAHLLENILDESVAFHSAEPARLAR
jgi:RNA polymerase sigma factor (sigma-70 family)